MEWIDKTSVGFFALVALEALAELIIGDIEVAFASLRL